MGKRERRPLFSAVAVGCAVLVASPSWAATVEPGVGDLTISQGQGFKPVKGPSSANVGDSIMVAPGGTATVTYEDGCKVTVQPGAVTTIAPLSPCASGSNAATSYYPNCKIDAYGHPYDCNDWGPWAGAGVFFLGLGGAIYAATRGNGSATPFVFFTPPPPPTCVSNC